MDRLVVVATDEATQRRRLRARDGIDEPEGRAQDRESDAARREGQAGRLRHRQLPASAPRPRPRCGASMLLSSPICARAGATALGERAQTGAAPSASTSSATSASRAPSSTPSRRAPTDLVVEIGPGEGALTGGAGPPGWARDRARDRSRPRRAACGRASRESRWWRPTREAGTTARSCVRREAGCWWSGTFPTASERRSSWRWSTRARRSTRWW